MKRTLLRNRILAGLLALVMVITTWVPTEQVKADDSVLPGATNTTFATARELQFDTSIAEEMSGDDNLRYYKFTVDGACELNVRGETRGHLDLYVYDASKTELYRGNLGFGITFSETVYLTGGQYYLKFETGYNVTFTASINYLEESFTETQDVNNDTVADASPIELRKKYKGVLAQNDEVDYYKFTVPAAGRINFNMTNATNGTLKYVIYDSGVNASFVKTISKGGKASEYITLARGNYYLAITKENSNYGGVGSYNFNIDYVANVPVAPTIKSVKNTSKRKMTVKWNKVTGADGYELQYCTKSNFKSKVVKKTISTSKTSASYSKLTKGKTYYVRMRSYTVVDGAKKYSKWSGKKSVKIKK